MDLRDDVTIVPLLTEFCHYWLLQEHEGMSLEVVAKVSGNALEIWLCGLTPKLDRVQAVIVLLEEEIKDWSLEELYNRLSRRIDAAVQGIHEMGLGVISICTAVEHIKKMRSPAFLNRPRFAGEN